MASYYKKNPCLGSAPGHPEEFDKITVGEVSDTRDNEALPEKAELQYNVGGRGRTQRRLHHYQVIMIGFCSGIGTGLFIAIGSAYAKAGPAGLILAYGIICVVLWSVVQSLAEMATLIPTAGSFPHFVTRFVDPAAGFSVAVSYTYCWVMAISVEASASAILVSYWSDISPAVVISIVLALVLTFNMFSVRFYGYAEVVGGAVKVLCFLGLVITSLVITAGGGPNHKTIGFHFWRDPGPWINFNGVRGPKGHLLGFLSALVDAAFSVMGTETVVIAAAESVNPHRSIPKAANRVALRIGFFYFLGAFVIGLIIDPRNLKLVTGASNARSSPFVIAIKQAGISVLPSVANAGILVSACSAGNSYVWVSSRLLVAMTTDHQFPQIFGRATKKGVPYVAVAFVWLFGLLAFLSLGNGGATQAFQWILSLGTVSGLVAWATFSFCYLRFYAALKAQGISRDTLPWKSPFQPYAAWVGFIGSTFFALINGFPVFLYDSWSTSSFVASYIGIPIFIVPLFIWKFWHRTKFVSAKDADLCSGRLVAGEVPEETTEYTSWWKRCVGYAKDWNGSLTWKIARG